jgi:hypothetical protein
MKFLSRHLPKHLLQQGFDGLALGTAFARANFSSRRYTLFGVMFVLVTPLGIALGMGISKSYAPGSKAALGSEATFNSISAGKYYRPDDVLHFMKVLKYLYARTFYA